MDSNFAHMFAVTAKIRSLYDCQLRLMHNIQPLPSGTDIANTVKYFSQTLLSKYNIDWLYESIFTDTFSGDFKKNNNEKFSARNGLQ